MLVGRIERGDLQNSGAFFSTIILVLVLVIDFSWFSLNPSQKNKRHENGNGSRTIFRGEHPPALRPYGASGREPDDRSDAGNWCPRRRPSSQKVAGGLFGPAVRLL